MKRSPTVGIPNAPRILRQRLPTPHLDKLAADGMVFTDGHSGGTTCKPSRYSLMIGRFAERKGNFNDSRPIIAERRATIASMLRHHGYRTAIDRLGDKQTVDRTICRSPPLVTTALFVCHRR